MNKLDKKQASTTPENWEDFRPETLLFATEVCMMDRGTKTIGSEDTGGWGALAGAITGFVIVGLLLASFQFMDKIQAPPQNTFKDFAPWKSTRISPVTQVAIGPATTPPKPAVVAPPPKPPAPKPVIAKEASIAKVQAATEAKAAEETATEAKAAEEAARAAAEAKAAEETAQAAAEAKAAEEAARAAAKAKAAKEAARAAAETKAAEEAARAAAKAKAAEEAARAAAEAKAAEEAAQAAAEAKVAEEAAAEAKAIKGVAQAKADIINMVKNWAAAWSDQKVDAYIDSYTSDFKPPQHKHREYWEAQRRKRLSKPSSISIQLSNIQASLAGDGTATATFIQIYKSPTFSDTVRKTLLLKQEAGSWKISSETSREL